MNYTLKPYIKKRYSACKFIRVCIILFALLLVSNTSHSQVHNFKSITLKDGLNESVINCITQDTTGKILFGTDAGVNIYDGIHFTYLTKNEGLPGSFIYALNFDSENNLLIGTDAGLVKKSGKDLKVYTKKEGLPGNEVYSIEISDDGIIYIGTNNGICLLENDKILMPEALKDLRDITVFDILISSNNDVWFATDKGLWCFGDRLEKVFGETEYSLQSYYAIAEDRFGNIWTGNNKNLIKLKEKRINRLWKNDDIGADHIVTLLEDSFGHIWIGTYKGLIKFDGNNFEKYSTSIQYSEEYVLTIFEDLEKNLWLGTDHGAKLHTGEGFVLFDYTYGIKSNVWSISSDLDGSIIAATDGTGIRKLTGNKFIDVLIPGLTSSTYWKILNNSGKIYFGLTEGFAIFDGKKFTKYDASNGFINNDVYEIFIDSKGNIWLGTDENGLYKFDGNKFTNYNESDGLTHNTVYSIIEDKIGNIWVGTEKGLNKFNGSIFLKYGNQDILKTTTIMSITTADENSLWIATFEKGLIRLHINDREKLPLENITTNEGLNDNACMFICKDNNGLLYIGTNSGLNRFYANAYLEEKTIKIISYNYSDGLPGKECNHGSAYIDHESNLWYATVDGVIKYNPFEDYSNGHIPKTYITNLKIFFEDVDLNTYGSPNTDNPRLPDNLVLPHDLNHLTFEFIGINLANPSVVKYKYMLEGTDKDYFTASGRSYATYSNLEPGDYQFKVLAQDGRGNWTMEPAVYSFTISRPYYRSFLFYVLIALLTGGIVLGSYKYKIEKVDRKNAELLKLIEQKDLYENKLQESEKDARGLFNDAHDPIIISSPETLEILDANKSALELYGFDYDELVGQSLEVISANIVGTKKNIRKVLSNKSLKNFEVKHKKRKGDFIELEVNASLINYKGKPAILAIHRDITSRKKLEISLNKAKNDAEKSEKLKSEFLAQMSHEIRTPVNTILSFISLLKDELYEKIDTDLKESFNLIENGGKRLIRTVDSLLNMSQIQSGNYYIKYEKLNLYKDILLNIYEDFKSTAKSRNLEFTLIEKTQKCIIEADHYSLNQLIINLVDNAIKYTDEGSVEIIVFLNERSKLSVSIKDTGIGISSEYQEFLFEPFTQEDTGYTRSYEGNGLGLALVKHYCEMNRASIHLKSEKGKGSTFTVTFHTV